MLDCYFSFAKGSTSAMLLPMVAIVLAIIMVASVVLIYNAFAMSLSEKVKYLGMLSSVGATKRQKRLSIYYEGFLLGLIGLPVGICAGILGIGITLKLLGKRIISTGMLMGVSDSNVSMKIVVPFWVLVGIIVISTLTIFISCAIPAKKASNITPIMALRQTNEIKVKSRKLRSPKIVKLLFGYEGELAHKNLKRNGRKARVITVSIALSVILFLSCNYFCDMFMRAADVETMPYQVGCFFDSKEYDNRDKILKGINGIDGVDDAYCVSYSTMIINSDSIDPELKNVFNTDNFTNLYSKQLEHDNRLFINFVDDDMFNELCKSNGIDYTRYYQGDCKALMLNNLNHREGTTPVMKDTVLGKKITNISTENPVEITVTDFVKYDSNDRLCNMNPTDSFSMYVPFSVYRQFDNSAVYCLGITTKQHEQVAEGLQKLSNSGALPDMHYADYEEQSQLTNTIVLILQVFVYGFIALISLITVFNIINTISSGIASRRKEFAMLKSVGTTPGGFNKMIMLESAFYGMRALIVSIPLSLLISKGMNMAIAEAAIPFEVNWITYLVVIAVVFVVIGVTMLFSVKQVQKENIIETLKEEIN
ncbi:MAG: ABC transporter permease [Eubacterium sp.]